MFFYSLLFAMFLLRKADAHGGIVDPKNMQLISQEIWKKSSRQCRRRICQGLFVEDQDLSKVPKFASGEEIPVKILIQVPHGGKAELILVDMVAEKPVQSQGKTVVLRDLGAQFGNRQQPRVQKFSVKVPSDASQNCSEPGKCAISLSPLGGK
ncbi:hypothetical protein VP01_2745g1 [Puccinia sorghi]|uniref:Uncharacterized protein n=1 Tax=Puccinia sorghi TaxID=27349 RepID=A0A0L6V350_9BASI|nr:hypothetical protein VP01_2745g1 [Puccinia sorghi]